MKKIKRVDGGEEQCRSSQRIVQMTSYSSVVAGCVRDIVWTIGSIINIIYGYDQQ